MSNPMQQAWAALDTMLETAPTPDQIETLRALLAEAESDHAEFFRAALHDLKNPLASIKGYADLLNNPAMVGELSEMQDQLLQVIRTNTKRMEGLLSDVSTMNKLRTGTLPVNAKMDMFKNIAMMVEQEMEPLARELDRELTVDVAGGLPLLNTDGELLALAVNKLVENGLRYGTEVVVSGQADGNTLVVTIEDNGCGMTSNELAHLGEPFYRADNDVVREFKGSGLGVPIAFGIFDLLDVQYTVESTPDEGTRFAIRLDGMT